MKRFIFLHALEIYSVIALVFIAVALIIGDLSFIQKVALSYGFIFVLHEWEEGRVPGDLTELIAERILCREIPEEAKKGNRVPAGILLLGMMIAAFFLDQYAVPILVMASLGLLEGFAHVMFIFVLELKKPYSPGFVTGEIEMVMSIILFVYLAKTGFASGSDYLIAILIMFACYFCLLRTIYAILGIPYRELPQIMKRRIRTLKEHRNASANA